MSEQKKGPGGQPGQGKGTETLSSTLRFYDTTNSKVLQAAKYPPGWLLARVITPPPANPITRRQGMALLSCIRVLGLEAYRGYKVRLGIGLDTPIHRLTKGQAWQLINAITTDLEASR